MPLADRRSQPQDSRSRLSSPHPETRINGSNPEIRVDLTYIIQSAHGHAYAYAYAYTISSHARYEAMQGWDSTELVKS